MRAEREYRVRWRREGMAQRTAIYQTERGAEGKVKALQWSDEVRDETPVDASDDYHQRMFAAMPSLVAEPVIEVREVGEWLALSLQQGEPDG